MHHLYCYMVNLFMQGKTYRNKTGLPNGVEWVRHALIHLHQSSAFCPARPWQAGRLGRSWESLPSEKARLPVHGLGPGGGTIRHVWPPACLYNSWGRIYMRGRRRKEGRKKASVLKRHGKMVDLWGSPFNMSPTFWNMAFALALPATCLACLPCCPTAGRLQLMGSGRQQKGGKRKRQKKEKEKEKEKKKLCMAFWVVGTRRLAGWPPPGFLPLTHGNTFPAWRMPGSRFGACCLEEQGQGRKRRTSTSSFRPSLLPTLYSLQNISWPCTF